MYREVNWFWKRIIKAAPTCTLWQYEFDIDAYVFKFHSRTYIPAICYANGQWCLRGRLLLGNY